MLFTCGDAGRNFSEQVNKELSGQAQENGCLEYAFGRGGESADAERGPFRYRVGGVGGLVSQEYRVLAGELGQALK